MATERPTRLAGIRIGMITVSKPNVGRAAVDVRRGPNDELILRYLSTLGTGVEQYAIAVGIPPAFCSEDDPATVATVRTWLETNADVVVDHVETAPDRG